VVRVALQEYAGRVLPSAFAFLAFGALIVVASLFMRRPSYEAAEPKAFVPAPALPAPPSPLDPLTPAAPPRLGETLRL
jgi:hypothetical protein